MCPGLCATSPLLQFHRHRPTAFIIFAQPLIARLVVPRLGLKRSCLYGVGVFAMSQVATGVAPSPEAFGASIFLTSIGCACVPALLAFIANQVTSSPNSGCRR